MIEVIPIQVTKGKFKNYCYLILKAGINEAILVDPALEKQKIEDVINERKAKIKAILITHHHFDHTDLADTFSNQYNVPIYIAQTGLEYYKSSSDILLIPIGEEKKFFINSFEISPIFTPGHSKDSICYLISNNLFTGDVLFNEGCGICTNEGGDPIQMFQSIQKLKKIISKEFLIYPGHSFGTSTGKSFSKILELNIYLHINDVDTFVTFRMRKNQRGLFDYS